MFCKKCRAQRAEIRSLKRRLESAELELRQERDAACSVRRDAAEMVRLLMLHHRQQSEPQIIAGDK